MWKSWFTFRSSSLGLVLEHNAIISHATVSLTLTSTRPLCWLRSLLLNQEMNQIRPHRPYTPCPPPPTPLLGFLQRVERGSVRNELGIALQWFERAATLFWAKSVLHLLSVCTEGSQLIGSEEKSMPCELACDQITLTTEPDRTLPITNRFYRMFYCVGCFLMAGCIGNQFGDWQIPESKKGGGVNFDMQYLVRILTTSDLLQGLLLCVFAAPQP